MVGTKSIFACRWMAETGASDGPCRAIAAGSRAIARDLARLQLRRSRSHRLFRKTLRFAESDQRPQPVWRMGTARRFGRLGGSDRIYQAETGPRVWRSEGV